MRIAAIQHDIVWEDRPATLARLAPLVGRAAGARVIVLTEMFATGFSMRPERIAEDEGGPAEQWLVEQAGHHDAYLIASIAQRRADGSYVNNAVVAAPDGSTSRYAKMHPFGYGGESEHYTAGDQYLTVPVDGLRMSVFVCYDLRFANVFWDRALATDAYVVVANWPDARREHWRALLRARAIENQAYVIGVNRVGSGGGNLDYAGDSVILDPLGRPLAEASVGESVLDAEIDAATVCDVRKALPFLPDRRDLGS